MSANIRKELDDDIIAVSDMFYQNNVQGGLDLMPALIQQLTAYISELSQSDMQVFMIILKSIMEAMEQKDYILLADLMVFELRPRLKEC